jgi:cell wall-associated NlpC family hydrolase
MTQEEARRSVVDEARRWIGTPYVEAARVRGQGCDCASLIAEVLTACGIIPREDLGFYGTGFAHGEKGNYMFRLMRHAKKTMDAISRYGTEVNPGDIVLVRVHSRFFNHGGIVTKWPLLVHAIRPEVEEINAANDCCGMWAFQEIAVFNPYFRMAG